jgi:hypothetical protein
MAPVRSDGNSGRGGADGGGVPLGVYGLIGKEIPAGAKGSGTIAQRQTWKAPKQTVKKRVRRATKG